MAGHAVGVGHERCVGRFDRAGQVGWSGGATQELVAEPEPDAADGDDEVRLGCPVVQLAAQVRQVDVDDVVVADPVLAPDRAQQFLAGADVTGVLAEVAEEVELDAGEVDDGVVDPGLAASEIDVQRPVAHDGRRWPEDDALGDPSRPAQQCPQPGGQFDGRDRLADDVVGAGAQQADPFELVGSGR